MSSFEDEFIARIAASFGVSAELMSAPFVLSPAERAYERLRRFYEEQARIEYDAAVWNAVLAACIDTGQEWGGPGIGWIDTPKKICGYDPQKLLPYYPKNYNLWDTETLASIVESLPTGENVFDRFFPKMGPPTRYYIEGGHFDMFDGAGFSDDEMIDFDPVPGNRSLAPFLAPSRHGKTARAIRIENVRLTYPSLRKPERAFERAFEYKMAVVKPDYAHLELIILAQMQDPRVRCILLDLDSPGGEVNPQLDLYALGAMLAKERKPKVASKPKREYLKHDPTKQHRRRRPK